MAGVFSVVGSYKISSKWGMKTDRKNDMGYDALPNNQGNLSQKDGPKSEKRYNNFGKPLPQLLKSMGFFKCVFKRSLRSEEKISKKRRFLPLR